MKRFHDLLESLLLRGVRSAVVRIEGVRGDLLFEGAAGLARPDAPQAMTSSTRFHLASVTKAITATLVLQLVEEGRVGSDGVDASIRSIDVFEPEILRRISCRGGESLGEQITLRHLLNHTSGLRDAFEDDAFTLGGLAPGSLLTRLLASDADTSKRWEPWDAKRPDDLEAGVLNFYLNRGHAQAALGRPGERFHYSDTGYVILGLIAERLGGQPLHEAFRQRIFEPLQMTDTYLAYRDDPAGIGPKREPEAEVWLGDRPFLSQGFSLSADWAGGGLVSTPRDLNVFLRALLGGRLFEKSETLRAMTEFTTPPGLAPPRVGIGLGIHRTSSGGIEFWGHTGAHGARMVVEPRSGMHIAGTINQGEGPSDWHWDFARAALQEMAA